VLESNCVVNCGVYVIILRFLCFMFSGLQDIDGEVAQHLKRLGRKDPTTKVIFFIDYLPIFEALKYFTSQIKFLRTRLSVGRC
jgi:hypothetical protein